ncbi:MAG: SRPBCC family protein [Parvibaculum sp.]|uniref:SRPBCC family protein n=1 Tax=Parvibaculum sp. TaxID=2024848 RepID=UPI0028410605|nr:SRPBCC family protein [Parvibaculum sp.]MDR3499267.1 SRPBCC family protein [Parvibaculum sp.]
MSAKGEIVKVSAVRFERRLPAPIERVWRFLTEAELLPAWYGNGTIEPRPGGAVRLMDGHIRGIVTRFQPPHALAYTWNVFEPNAPDGASSDYPESYLQLTLSSQGKDVALVLTHFPIPEAFEKQTAMGWHTYLDIVEAAARGEAPADRQTFMHKNAALYGVDLNNLAR